MKVRYTMVNQASGSIGGLTAAKNRGGNYWRKRVKPLNPQTTRQYEVRGNMSAAAAAWRMLDETQRLLWTGYASTIYETNGVGEPKQLTGINVFSAANSLRLLANLAQLTDAPTDFGRATLTPPNSVFFDAGTISIDITATDSWAATQNGVIFLFIGKNNGQGISSYKNPWRLAGFYVRPVGAPTDPVVIAEPAGGWPFGEPDPSTYKTWVRIRSMDYQGRVSPDIVQPLVNP